jgi:small GTP-binding protein
MEKDTLLSPRSMFNILILGDHSTGKTSILYKYMNLMSHVNITTGYEQHIHYTKIFNKDFSFNILDFSGHNSYNKFVERSISTLNYDGIIFVFDLTSINSFKNLSYWIEISNPHKNKLFNILIGNKSDKSNRIVSSNVINDFVQKNNLYYFETSANSNTNITNAFNFFFNNIVNIKLHDTNILMDKVNNNQQPKRNCCFNAF